MWKITSWTAAPTCIQPIHCEAFCSLLTSASVTANHISSSFQQTPQSFDTSSVWWQSAHGMCMSAAMKCRCTQTINNTLCVLYKHAAVFLHPVFAFYRSSGGSSHGPACIWEAGMAHSISVQLLVVLSAQKPAERKSFTCRSSWWWLWVMRGSWRGKTCRLLSGRSKSKRPEIHLAHCKI